MPKKQQVMIGSDDLVLVNGAKLRHCTFVGMRDDKPAAKVVRET